MLFQTKITNTGTLACSLMKSKLSCSVIMTSRRFFDQKTKNLTPSTYMIPTIKHPKHIMVWGCISSKGVGTIHKIDSKMDAKMYVDIIRKNLGKSVRKLKMGSIGKITFQQGILLYILPPEPTMFLPHEPTIYSTT